MPSIQMRDGRFIDLGSFIECRRVSLKNGKIIYAYVFVEGELATTRRL